MICVDANVVLDVILGRKNMTACQEFIERNKGSVAITMLTLGIVMYYAERDKLRLPAVKTYLETFVWLAINEADGQWAFANYDGKDFEDALQIGCALREQCSTFVTLDQKLAKKHKAHLPIKLIKAS